VTQDGQDLVVISTTNKHYNSRGRRSLQSAASIANMYNSLTRIQNVFGFFTTVAFVVAAFIAASDFTYDRTPSAHVKTTNVQV